MKKIYLVSLGFVLCLSLAASPTVAKTVTSNADPVRQHQDTGFNYSLDSAPEVLNQLRSCGPPYPCVNGDTTFLAWYRFSIGAACNDEGWTTVDLTAQLDDYFHVDDFAGVTGLSPLEGSQSLWCGVNVSLANPYCGYATLPGYGNGWDQAFCTRTCLAVADSTTATVTFLTLWDSEPSYDQTFVEMDDCNTPEAWTALTLGGATANPALLDGTGSGVVTATIPSGHSGAVRVRFHFVADGAWSDEDGLWNTVGAITIDSLSITGAGTAGLPVEDFEGVGGIADWESCTPPGYGDYAGLLLGPEVVQEDPCFSNLSCMWAFFFGSTDNYGCGGFPLQAAMPYGNDSGQYLNNGIESPVIPWAGTGSVGDLSFVVYRDLPLDNLQFYTWGVASIDSAGCQGAYRDRNFVHFGAQKDWLRVTQTFGDLLDANTASIRVQLAAVDMCGVWCPGAGNVGTGACHSHAPLFDDVRVWRINSSGPQWSVRDIDQFNDGFPEDGGITGTARADMATDRLPSTNPGILPGDSAVVTVSDPQAGGFATDFSTGFPAVYAWVSVLPLQAAKTGNALTQDTFRWPVVGSMVVGTTTWYKVRMDTSFTDGAARTGAQPDRFCVDLNDNLFNPGDTINWVYSATGAGAITTYWTEFTGGTSDMAFAFANPSEFQILPGAGNANGGDVLYVDAFSGRGAQPFFDSAFEMIGIDHQIDRFDIRGPSSSVSNRPGHRVKAVFTQLLGVYRKIIWNTGDLSTGLIGDGTGSPEKADDAAMLVTFLNNLTGGNGGGVYFSGDDIADELYNKTLPGPGLIALRAFITGTVGVGANNASALGFGTAPLVVGAPGSHFDHVAGPDTLVAYGGCPQINDFDVITPLGTAAIKATYEGNLLSGGAIIGQKTTNLAGDTVGVLLSGFSYHYIRDDRPNSNGVPDRVEHLFDILIWLNNSPPIPVNTGPVALKNSLSPNYPNPFNPRTTIEFSLKDRSFVTLNVYNVAGQLVRTLVSEVRDAGIHKDVVWDGRNSAGQSVSSGVYFYKLVSKDFTQTRKMVLLK